MRQRWRSNVGRCYPLLVPWMVLMGACGSSASPGNSPTPEETPDQDTPFVDLDGDGFPAGDSSELPMDCDDGDAAAYPGAEETPYDGIDQDCDGSDLTDVDGDGSDAVDVGGSDCDDDDPEIGPDALEVPYDAVDQDCDGSDLTDVDGDGEPAIIAGGNDCDDADPQAYPGADEIQCSAVDENCNGLEDDAGSVILELNAELLTAPETLSMRFDALSGTLKLAYAGAEGVFYLTLARSESQPTQIEITPDEYSLASSLSLALSTTGSPGLIFADNALQRITHLYVVGISSPQWAARWYDAPGLVSAANLTLCIDGEDPNGGAKLGFTARWEGDDSPPSSMLYLYHRGPQIFVEEVADEGLYQAMSMVCLEDESRSYVYSVEQDGVQILNRRHLTEADGFSEAERVAETAGAYVSAAGRGDGRLATVLFDVAEGGLYRTGWDLEQVFSPVPMADYPGPIGGAWDAVMDSEGGFHGVFLEAGVLRYVLLAEDGGSQEPYSDDSQDWQLASIDVDDAGIIWLAYGNPSSLRIVKLCGSG